MKNTFLLIAIIAIGIGIYGFIHHLATKDKTPSSTRSKVKKYKCVEKKCSQIASCDEAKYLLKKCGYKYLDRDNDGIPCENLCGQK